MSDAKRVTPEDLYDAWEKPGRWHKDRREAFVAGYTQREAEFEEVADEVARINTVLLQRGVGTGLKLHQAIAAALDAVDETRAERVFLALVSGRKERNLCGKDPDAQCVYFRTLWALARMATEERKAK